MNRSLPQPRKVLHVLNSAGGGAALSTIGLIESHKKEGIAACAVCHDAGTLAERERLREATEGDVLFTPLYWWNKKIRAAYWKRPLIEARQIWRTGWARLSAREVTSFAAQQHADLIHTNTILTPEGGMAARSLGIPHVWHLRELLGPGQPFRLGGGQLALGRYFHSHCSKLIANSRATADRVRECLPLGLLEVIPNGIDVSRFSHGRGKLPDAPVVIAMVGNLSSRTKKHGLFIEAASRVDPSLGAQFRIYGHDPSNDGRNSSDEYVNRLRKTVEQLDLTSQFQWPGYVHDPASIMSEIDILVHPADNESCGRVVVEAMAAGLPVVGVRGGGVAEIIEHGITGFMGAPDDPTQLGVFVDRLVGDPALRRSLGQNGRRRAETFYSLESCASAVMGVYQKAMKRPLTSH